MYDQDKATTWIRGQIELENGETLFFEFSPDSKYGGGRIKIAGDNSPPPNDRIFNDASSLFGSKLRELLIGGKLLFSGIVEEEALRLTSGK